MCVCVCACVCELVQSYVRADIIICIVMSTNLNSIRNLHLQICIYLFTLRMIQFIYNQTFLSAIYLL